MRNDVLIRRAVPADAAQLLLYLSQVGSESNNLLKEGGPPQYTVEQEVEFIKRGNSARSALFVALIGGEIVAVANLHVEESKRIRHQGRLAISVRQKYWGQGVGTMMMTTLVELARALALEVLCLEVKSDNERAIALYRKFGFERFGVFRKYFQIDGVYYDFDYMNLYL